MPRPRAPATAQRKLPKQVRSTRLVEAILKAAIRVLERDGAAGFTTVSVAARAGVSVGSLYQYFPNKESILARLQADEWAETGRLLESILANQRLGAAQRLRAAMRAFFRSEYDEAPLRRALGDAAPLYRDAPLAKQQRRRGLSLLGALIAEAAPGLRRRRRQFAAELYLATLAALGKHVSDNAGAPAEVDTWARAIAEMFLAWLGGPKRRPRKKPRRN